MNINDQEAGQMFSLAQEVGRLRQMRFEMLAELQTIVSKCRPCNGTGRIIVCLPLSKKEERPCPACEKARGLIAKWS